MKFGSAEAENSLSLDRATDDCQPVPSLSPPLRVNEWATKILPSSVLRISSATYLTVKSLYLSERIPQRYKFTLPRNQHLFDSFSRRGRLKKIAPRAAKIEPNREEPDPRSVSRHTARHHCLGRKPCGALCGPQWLQPAAVRELLFRISCERFRRKTW